MHLITQLLTHYETVRLNIDKPPGTIFNYSSKEENGLKLFAEIMVRTRRRGLSNFFIACSSVTSLLVSPTTKLKNCFKIEGKLDPLFEDGCFLLCLQVETDLDKGNYLVLKTDEQGSTIGLYAVYDHKKVPYAITDMMMDYDMGVSDDLMRLSRVVVGELVSMQSRTAPSGFGGIN